MVYIKLVFKNKLPITTGINTLAGSTLKVNAYPNPNNGIFNVNITNTSIEKLTSIDVYNAIGVKITTVDCSKVAASGVQSIPVDLSEHKAGVYLIEIKSNGNILGSTKIVKY